LLSKLISERYIGRSDWSREPCNNPKYNKKPKILPRIISPLNFIWGQFTLIFKPTDLHVFCWASNLLCYVYALVTQRQHNMRVRCPLKIELRLNTLKRKSDNFFYIFKAYIFIFMILRGMMNVYLILYVLGILFLKFFL